MDGTDFINRLLASEKAVLLKFLTKFQAFYLASQKEVLLFCISHWKNFTVDARKEAQVREQRERTIDVLRYSTRGDRSTMEKEVLRRYIVSQLTCIPKSITFSEMDKLCNELDWIPLIGRSILFLQGDFGNVYYMIARGTVGLYLEPSKDREMVIAREFGSLRAQPYHGTDEDLQRLGNNIFNLPQGAGFGEYAILASTNKIRSCAAVAIDPESILLIMHAETYNAVLRQHHYRQKQLSSATALLGELPLFQHYNYSKIASIAYTMRSQTFGASAMVANYGDVINNVMLIVSGQVKVFAAPFASGADDNDESNGGQQMPTAVVAANRIIERRIPKLSVAMLGRGQIIGESEAAKNLRTFQMTYVASSASLEVLEMPLTVYKENVCTEEFKQTAIYRNVEEINRLKEERRVGRLHRAYNAMKDMMGGQTRTIMSKAELMTALPVLVNPNSTIAERQKNSAIDISYDRFDEAMKSKTSVSNSTMGRSSASNFGTPAKSPRGAGGSGRDFHGSLKIGHIAEVEARGIGGVEYGTPNSSKSKIVPPTGSLSAKKSPRTLKFQSSKY